MADTSNFPRQISSLRILCELGRDNGMSTQQCLHASGILEASLHIIHGTVSVEQEIQVVRNILAVVGNEHPWGLNAGMRHHPTTFAIWGFAILSSITTRQAVDVGLRYLRLTSAFSNAHIVDQDAESILQSDASKLPEDVRRFFIERDAAMLISIQRDVLPMNIPLTRLEFQFPEPKDVNPYIDLFGIRPRFEMPLNQIGADAAFGRLKLPQGDASTLRYCEEECQRLLDLHQQRLGMSGKVRDWLNLNTWKMPTMQLTAEHFGLSARSLRRRLADEDTDYESLVIEIRQSLAKELLKADVMTIEQVANQLGYSEVASFSRAFKRWTGLAPNDFRHRLKPTTMLTN